MAGKICHQRCPGGSEGLATVVLVVALGSAAYAARVLIGEVLAVILACMLALAVAGVIVLVVILRGIRSLYAPAPAPALEAEGVQAISAPQVLAIEAPRLHTAHRKRRTQ